MNNQLIPHGIRRAVELVVKEPDGLVVEILRCQHSLVWMPDCYVPARFRPCFDCRLEQDRALTARHDANIRKVQRG